jgi:hypothetical protein
LEQRYRGALEQLRKASQNLKGFVEMHSYPALDGVDDLLISPWIKLMKLW